MDPRPRTTSHTSRLQAELLLVLSVPRRGSSLACTLVPVHFAPLAFAASLLPPALLVLQPSSRVLLPAGCSHAENEHLLSQQQPQA